MNMRPRKRTGIRETNYKQYHLAASKQEATEGAYWDNGLHTFTCIPKPTRVHFPAIQKGSAGKGGAMMTQSALWMIKARQNKVTKLKINTTVGGSKLTAEYNANSARLIESGEAH
jgi:hypothetical protein